MIFIKKNLVAFILFVTNVLLTLTLVLTLSPKEGPSGSQGPMGNSGASGLPGSNGETGSPGVDGQTPYIGENGNWWIGEVDTHIPATGFSQTQINRMNDAFPSVIHTPDYFASYIAPYFVENEYLSFSSEEEQEAYVLAKVSAGYIRIDTFAQFLAIGTDANSLSFDYVLGADLDLTTETSFVLLPLANFGSNLAFTGIFDGAGFTMRNLTINTNQGFTSLFGKTQGAVIKNLFIADATINLEQNPEDFYHHIGFLASEAIDTLFANIDLINVSINSDYANNSDIGFIAAEAIRSIFLNINLTNAEIYRGYSNLAFVSGRAYYSSFMGITINQGLIREAVSYLGAVIGQSIHNFIFGVRVFDFEVYGLIAAYYSVGGVAGFIERNFIWYVSLEFITIDGSDHLGALAGEIVDSEVSFVEALEIDITTGNTGAYAGGLFGHMIDTALLFTILTTIRVDGAVMIGGIAGEANNPFIFATLINQFTIEGEAMVGGLFGKVFKTFTIANSGIADGLIIGQANIGGMIGMAEAGPGISQIESSYVNVELVSDLFDTNDPELSFIRGTGTNMGGLIGLLVGGAVKLTVYQVPTYALIVGESNLGGMFGLIAVANEVSQIDIIDSYASSIIYGFIQGGGLVGFLNSGMLMVKNSFFMSQFNFVDNLGEEVSYKMNFIGGIVGINAGSISFKNVYYLNKSTPVNLLASTATGGASGGISVSDEVNFYDPDLFLLKEVWDMAYVWFYPEVLSLPIPIVLVQTLTYLYDHFEFLGSN